VLTNISPLIILVVVMLIVATLTIGLLSRRPLQSENKKSSETSLAYRRRNLLTANEQRFYTTLRVSTNETILAKVRLADLVESSTNSRSDFARISQKHIDFVLADPTTLTPKLLIELDDRSHQREDRKARDQFVDGVATAAGIPILHISTRVEYDPDTLRELIRNRLLQQ